MKKFLFILIILQIFGFTAIAQNQPKEIFVSCDPDDFQNMYENYEQTIYIPVSIVYNGVTYTDAEMRIRGDGSIVYPKKSLKVKFNSDPFFNGRYSINFNAEYEDHSYIRQAISARIMRETGSACFYTEHVRLYINGVFFGLYQMIENVDEQFLEARNLDTEANLYKADDRGACLSIYDDLDNSWDEENGSGNKVDLAELIGLVHNAPIDNYKTFLTDHVNYDQLINQIAANLLTANASTYYHNYFMYHDVNGNNKWSMFPWDLDKTCSVYAWSDYTMTSNSCEHDNPMIEKAFLNQQVLSDIRSRITEIRSQIFTTDHIWPIIDSLVSSISASVAEDLTDDVPDMETFAQQVQTEKSFFLNRYDNLMNQFDHLVSSFVAEPTPGINPVNTTLKWTSAIDPDGGVVKYNLYITSDTCFETASTQVFQNISASEFTLSNLEPGNYFWKVTAIDADREVEAYESNLPLTIAQVTQFPCSVENNTTLIAANSPYIVDCNAQIAPNATLTIEPGVEIRIKSGFHILVKGSIRSNGTKSLPVRFIPESGNGTWDSISIIQATSACSFTNTVFIDGVIHIETSDVNFEGCQFRLENKQLLDQNVLIGQYWGKFRFADSEIIGNNTGQGLEISFVSSANVINSKFADINDPVEYISINSGSIMNNDIQKSVDDGIDLNNCKNIVIANNWIKDCQDNGISLGNETAGPTQNINVYGNVVVNSKNGITVKDGSVANLDRNTFASNEIAIKAWQKNPGMGGGIVNAVNNIFYNTTISVTEIDPFSEVNLKYCLANTEQLAGNNNLFADPDFEDPENQNYRLQSTSPCINSGDPETGNDPDGTRADIGAYFFNLGVFNVVINEINYNPSPDFSTEDWIELYNPESQDINISGWIFKDDDDEHIFSFPQNTVLPSGAYLVVCRDKSLFLQRFPDVSPIVGNFSFGLGSGGDKIRLFNEGLVVIDSLTFDDADPWPVEPDGNGPTLELKNPFLDNSIGQNWCGSSDHGTPGAINSCFAFSVDDHQLQTDVNIYPIPADDWLYLDFPSPAHLKYIKLFDLPGNEIKCFGFNPDFPFGYIDISISDVPNGAYIIEIIFGKNSQPVFRKILKK